MKSYTVTDEWDGSRIDRLVRALHPATPFAVIQTLLRKGRITLNGKRVPGRTRLAVGDTVEIRDEILGAGEDGPKNESPGAGGGMLSDKSPDTRDGVLSGKSPGAGGRRPKGKSRRARGAQRWGSIGEEISVLHEDGEILVIDKPRGLVVQPGNRKSLGSLLDLLEEYGAGRTSRQMRPMHNGDLPPFPYTPVHRLDRETSGVLVVAKTRHAARALSAAFSTRLVEKRYLALVEGAPFPEHGVIDTPLTIKKGARSTATCRSGGKRAETQYSLLGSRGEGCSLLDVHISTGRTHQIRAHLASIGHPVAGDRRYGARLHPDGWPHLHAWKISFPHPDGSGAVEATAPPPPWAGME